jgi:tRNA/tmRNA/rRNA uracil-C5-methylase (TrmA/RlmC/RlmD family)
MIRRVEISGLAPTGEGIARTAEGVGFVAGALPGEEVDAEVVEARRRFWKGRTSEILRPSPDRASGPHARGCPGCDWAHLELAKARDWKRALFLETMERIGQVPAAPFGELPIAPSPAGYRLRARFHVAGRGTSSRVGFFAPRTHRVEPADGCEALGEGLRALLPNVAAAIARSGAAVAEISTVEAPDARSRLARAVLAPGSDRREVHSLAEELAPLFDGLAVEDSAGAAVARHGAPRIDIPVAGRSLPATAGVFFQSNRFLLDRLVRDVAARAALPPGRALDAFGGVGLFGGALRSAGHAVTTVEADSAAADLAAAARARWGARDWTIERAAVLDFVARDSGTFDVAVVDPPRAGLGLRLAAALPARVGRRLIYVSCDPATLARDLAALTAGGLVIREALLYDLFALTHRVEALVVLERDSAG